MRGGASTWGRKDDMKYLVLSCNSSFHISPKLKGLKWEPQTGKPRKYSGKIIECKDLGRYIPIIFLLYSWGSLFGVARKVPC